MGSHSSDLDVADASMMEYMKDLALTSAHQTKSSPIEVAASSVPKSQSTINLLTHRREKLNQMIVFKDNAETVHAGGQPEKGDKNERKISVPGSIGADRRHARSKSDTATKTCTPRNAYSHLLEAPPSSLCISDQLKIEDQTRAQLNLTRELHDLAQERTTLLKRLNAIDQKEQQIIKSLLEHSAGADSVVYQEHNKTLAKEKPSVLYVGEPSVYQHVPLPSQFPPSGQRKRSLSTAKRRIPLANKIKPHDTFGDI